MEIIKIIIEIYKIEKQWSQKFFKNKIDKPLARMIRKKK
jgi:hypothetical protein